MFQFALLAQSLTNGFIEELADMFETGHEMALDGEDTSALYQQMLAAEREFETWGACLSTLPALKAVAYSPYPLA